MNPVEGGASHLRLGRKQHRIVTHAIERWLGAGAIDEQTAVRLKASLVHSAFDWQRTARYAFIIAIVCVVISISGALADAVLMKLLERLFSAPAVAKCAFFALVSAGVFRYGLYLRKRHPTRIYRNEAVFFLGVLALGGAVGFFGEAVDTGSGHYSLLFLLACVLYGVLGVWFPSKLVWVFALLSLSAWIGTETGYLSGHGMYFLGMNYPLRFVLFGAILSAAGIAGERQLEARHERGEGLRDRLLAMSAQTKIVGLLHLFIALWILSIFGNYGDVSAWERARQIELFHWAVLFGAVAVGAIWLGLRYDDATLRGFGLTFLFINLYTRFFEFFWNSMHKAVFFALLAVSFWYLGTRAEVVWNLGRRKPAPEKRAAP
jgi:hypothetical protein